MPIRFRCAYCNQLMGIARRKAGTVVRCPTCSGQVVVPQPVSEAASQQVGKELKAAGGVFEEADFDRVLEPVAGTPPPPQKSLETMGSSSNALPGIDVEPVSYAGDDTTTGGSAFSVGKLILLIIIMLVLIGLAFLAGLLVGRSSVSP